MPSAALTIDGFGVDFGGFKAVNSVSMIIEEGELRVLLGANGAGKTTLMDLISGKTKSTEGRVFLYDTDITNWQEHEIARAGVGRKFQIPSVFRDLTVRSNLESRRDRRSRRAAPISRFGLSKRASRAGSTRCVELTGLGDEARQARPATSVHGQTQWLELGMLIAQDAEGACCSTSRPPA